MTQLVGVRGICRDEEALLRAIGRLREQGCRDIKIFSPFPSERLLASLAGRTNPIPFYTITGGILGFLTGLGFPIWTSLQWDIIGGGKPVVSVPPFLVIAFELTMLFAGAFTVAGLLIHSGLSRHARVAAPQEAYDARFSDDRFGIFVACEMEMLESVQQMALAAGLEEVTVAGR
jgi:hypothetical protein